MTKENAEALEHGIIVQVAAAIRGQLITTAEAETVLEEALQCLLRGKAQAMSEYLFKKS